MIQYMFHFTLVCFDRFLCVAVYFCFHYLFQHLLLSYVNNCFYIYALSELIEYFKSRSTLVYVVLLDASKAFDKIDHWTFFRKLIDRNVPKYLIKILCYWYQHQLMAVRWGCSILNVFNVTNGVQQGGILSPKLFNIYINGLRIC